MNKAIKYLAFSAVAMATINLSSCKKDDDNPEDVHEHDEQEQITKVVVTLQTDGESAMTYSWSDNDGIGGDDPITDEIVLSASKTYSASIQFVDASGTEEHDLTSEIEEEAQEHIVCFDASTSNLIITRTDSDGTYEIGLASEWVTSEAVSDASVTISLKHQPDVKDGTCDPGASDVEVSFPLIIE